MDGKTVWLHSSQLATKDEVKTSKLGHIRHGNVEIYKNIGDATSIKAGTQYTHAVYYIKKQATLNGKMFYLISTKPSSENGVIGWVDSTDLSIHTHVGVTKKNKTYTLKGTGKAYTKAWGGNKDLVHSNLTAYKNQKFYVHLTEKVGKNTWYRGKLNGKTVWIHNSYVK